MGIFLLVKCVGVAWLVSGSLSVGIAPYAAVLSVRPWEKGSSGASQVAILVLSPEIIFSDHF